MREYIDQVPQRGSSRDLEIMKELRRVDDNIIPRLNSTDTHSQKACGQFFAELAEAYKKREEAVNYCLKVP